MTIAAPTQAASVDERIRVRLLALTVAYEAHDPAGVSVSEMARGAGVSRQQFDRVLAGTRKLHPDQIAGLPSRAYAAVLAEIERARGERCAVPAPRTPSSRGLRLAALVGRYVERVERFEADGVLDAREAAQLTVSLGDIEREAAAGGDDLARAVVQ